MRYVFSRDKCVDPDMIYWVSSLVKKEQRLYGGCTRQLSLSASFAGHARLQADARRMSNAVRSAGLAIKQPFVTMEFRVAGNASLINRHCMPHTSL